jgi:hypothetical protein
MWQLNAGRQLSGDFNHGEFWRFWNRMIQRHSINSVNHRKKLKIQIVAVSVSDLYLVAGWSSLAEIFDLDLYSMVQIILSHRGVQDGHECTEIGF